MLRVAVAFSGPSNSGKTTLILKVAKSLIDSGLKVVVIKHDPSDKARFDTPGKDSFKFSEVGADVVVASPTRTTFFSQNSMELDEIISMVGEFDVLIVEGLKYLALPRISVFRDEIDASYLKFSDAIATNSLKCNFEIENLDINDYEAVKNWVLKNGKKV